MVTFTSISRRFRLFAISSLYFLYLTDSVENIFDVNERNDLNKQETTS